MLDNLVCWKMVIKSRCETLSIFSLVALSQFHANIEATAPFETFSNER